MQSTGDTRDHSISEFGNRVVLLPCMHNLCIAFATNLINSQRGTNGPFMQETTYL